jgi:hypothetical protein
MTSRSRWSLVACLMACVLAACSNGGTAPHVTSSFHDANGPESGIGIDWTNPYPGQTEADQSAAASDVSFKPVQPQYGSPEQIVVSDPKRVPEEDRVLAYVYDDSTYGHYMVLETVAENKVGTASADWKQLVASCRPETGCDATFHFVTLNGSQGLVGQPGGGSASSDASGPSQPGAWVEWVENGVYMDLISESMTSNDVASLAQKI